MRHRVAIIGTGIAGMACAWYLRDQFSLTLYEKGSVPGGHTSTISVPEGDRNVPVDTGFMVYNEATYPNLVKLFQELDVKTQETDMSFGVQNRSTGLEYACTGLNSFFAQRGKLANWKHWKLLKDILRFFKEAKQFLANDPRPEITLEEFLKDRGFAAAFINNYLLPMTGAIWSTPPTGMLEYPASSLFRFMENHRLLGVGIQYRWRTVSGGSRTYRDRLLSLSGAELHTSQPVTSVLTAGDKPCVVLQDGSQVEYDHVILATHADQALSLLAEPTPLQKGLLGAFKYNRNPVILHSDSSVMPNNRRAWASWNFRMEPGADGEAQSSTHYWMNRLQNVSDRRDYFVSVDYDGPLREDSIHWQTVFEHPRFNRQAIEAQRDLPLINASRQLSFCGSYFRYGFHEDALVSSLAVVKSIKERMGISHELLSV